MRTCGSLALLFFVAGCASGTSSTDAGPEGDDGAAGIDAGPAADGMAACTMHSCFTGVTCTANPASPSGYDCGPCPAGYSGDGKICTDADDCAGSPCFTGVVCTDLPAPEAGFECGACPAGYEGSGFTCTDIDACASGPCFDGVSCLDEQPPSTGFECASCPIGYFGDGEACDLSCEPATSIACGSSVASSNSAIGSSDNVDAWSCLSVQETGPEIVYAFVAPADGVAAASLTNLNADLDMIVIEDAGGLCDPADQGLCRDTSTNSSTSNEYVDWHASAGVTYYIIIDGRQGAISSFTLQIGTPNSELTISEIGMGTDDFVELRNGGVCPVDLGGFAILHDPAYDNPFEFVFPGGNLIDGGGGVFRAIEPSAAPFTSNEVDVGFSIPDLPVALSYTALCTGSCDTTSCTNMLDYVERDGNLTDDEHPAGPSCAVFDPGPVDATNAASFSGLRRTGYAGSPTTWQRSDWAFGTSTRN